jgi:hypothetical protein
MTCRGRTRYRSRNPRGFAAFFGSVRRCEIRWSCARPRRSSYREAAGRADGFLPGRHDRGRNRTQGRLQVNRSAGLCHALGDGVLEVVEPPVQRRKVFGLFTFIHEPLVWPTDGGEPDPIEHTDDNIARPGSGRHSLDQVPVAAVRAGNHPQQAVVAGGHRATPHAGQHLPLCAGAVPGQDAGRRPGNRSRAAARGPSPPSSQPGPITVWAALNTSRCRTQAESAGRADRRLMVEPRRKRRHAKLREANRTSGSAGPSVRPTATAKSTRTNGGSMRALLPAG